MQALLLASPRNHLLAQILLAGGLFWFFLLVAPEGLGVLSRFRVGLAEFEGIRWLLQLACPVFLVLMVTQVKNLLFPRALGIFGLMVAAPLLSAAFLQEPVTRLLIPIWCYIVIFLSILWIGKPYLYRDMVNKICSKPTKLDKIKVAVPNDTTNEARALTLLEKNGFFKLDRKSVV